MPTLEDQLEAMSHRIEALEAEREDFIRELYIYKAAARWIISEAREMGALDKLEDL